MSGEIWQVLVAAGPHPGRNFFAAEPVRMSDNSTDGTSKSTKSFIQQRDMQALQHATIGITLPTQTDFRICAVCANEI